MIIDHSYDQTSARKERLWRYNPPTYTFGENSMSKIVVTGGSGKAGRAVVRDLLDHGYDVLNVDTAPPAERISPFLRADLTHYGEAIEVLQGADAVVHLAAIPAPGLFTEEVTFRVDNALNYNVFSAALALGLKRVVWA